MRKNDKGESFLSQLISRHRMKKNKKRYNNIDDIEDDEMFYIDEITEDD